LQKNILINRYIDHTLLKPLATRDQIIKLCEEAKQHQFATVCIPSSYIKTAREILHDSNVKVCTVISFPLGYTSTSAKTAETKAAIEEGAEEIDMVINQSWLKSGEYDEIHQDINSVKIACHHLTLKVILETAHLTDAEITKAAEIAEEAGADYVKTSTGFGESGASFHAVEIMKKAISSNVKIKASGGIKDYETAKKYIDLGVSRIGTSSGIQLINQEKNNS
jgi:deoxyribose-phosphate aldolase